MRKAKIISSGVQSHRAQKC